jgi:hypothetical protein
VHYKAEQARPCLLDVGSELGNKMVLEDIRLERGRALGPGKSNSLGLLVDMKSTDDSLAGIGHAESLLECGDVQTKRAYYIVRD